MPGLDPRRADLSVAGSVLLDTILRRLGADEFTLCDLALREGLVLDYIHRNSARIRKVERYPDVRRRSVIELGERCGYWPEHAQQVARLALAIFDQTRSVHGLGDRERDWLEYGALLHDVGVHISYERHHRHSYYLIKNGDLRGFDPQEIEIIALLARYHRQATPKKSHEGYGDLQGVEAADRQGAGGDGPAGRGARPQPRAGARRHRSLSARRRLPGPAAHDRRRGARALGGAPPRRAARTRARQADPLRSRRTRLTRNRPRMLNNLTTPHEYPGKLFVVEGIDGSGKTTQLALLAKWLSAAGHPVFVTEWNSSALVKAATKTGKKKNALTPMTFSLLHATDFADRLLYNIIPPLKAGMIVLADRYTYTAFARDATRGVDRRWVRELYSFAVQAGPRRLLPRADRGVDRSAARAPGEAEVLRGRHGHGLEPLAGRELPDLPGQGARRVRPARRRVRPERRRTPSAASPSSSGSFRKLVSQHLEIEPDDEPLDDLA